MSPRAIELHTARVLIDEARKRRLNGETRMADVMLQWAANARARAAAIAAQPLQMRVL